MSLTTRVLIVEDHPIMREGIKSSLHPRCMVVEQLANGNEALAFLRTGGAEQVDLVTLDYGLPDMNGAQLMRHIAAEFPKLATLMFTEWDQDYIVAECMRSGGMGFVSKCDDARFLLEAVNMIANGRTCCSPIPLENLRRYLCAPKERKGSPKLSDRERECLMHVSTGLQMKEVAVRMNVTIHTALEYFARVRRKYGAKNRAELLRRVLAVREEENHGVGATFTGAYEDAQASQAAKSGEMQI